MERTLANKVIVITGGANGIGFDIAEKYLRHEAKVVVLLDIDEVQGKKAVEILTSKFGNAKAVFLKCDVTTDLEIVPSIIDTYKQIDVLVNSVGIATEIIPINIMNVNATAVIEWSIKFEEHMNIEKGGKGGTIINIASIFGYRTAPYSPIYQASKHAVMGFTKAMGHVLNYEKSGVRVVAICPGFTKTRLNAHLWDPKAKLTEEFRAVEKDTDIVWQDVEAVGEAAIEVFEKADSGTAWVIEENKLSKVTA